METGNRKNQGGSLQKPFKYKQPRYVAFSIISVVLVILIAGIFVVLEKRDDALARPSDEVILSGGELIGDSGCSLDADCISLYGANNYCSAGQCYFYAKVNLERPSSSGRGSSGGGSSSSSSSGSSDGSGDSPAAPIDIPASEEKPSGLLGFFSKFFTGNVVSEAAGKPIYYNDGYVGIGTAEPERKLHISGGGGAMIESTVPVLTFKAAADKIWTLVQAGDFAIAEDGTTNRLVLKSGGNVGIGTAEPSTTLDVNGNLKTTQGAFFQGWTSMSGLSGVFIGNIDSQGYDIHAWNGDAGPGSLILNRYGGNVGIGTVNPSAVNGAFGRILEISSSGNTGLLLSSTAATGGQQWGLYSGNDGTFHVWDSKNGVNAVSMYGGVNPAVRLYVAGSIRLQPVITSLGACDSGTLGTITYHSAYERFYGCTGHGWVPLNS